jgi:hypothetical protein
VDAFLCEKKIDGPTYEAELSRLGAENERIGFELATTRSELRGVKYLVCLRNTGSATLRRSWQNFSSEEKVRFQHLLLPRGAVIRRRNIGTAESAFFRYLQPNVANRNWRPGRDSNPCWRRERALSEASRRRRRARWSATRDASIDAGCGGAHRRPARAYNGIRAGVGLRARIGDDQAGDQGL